MGGSHSRRADVAQQPLKDAVASSLAAMEASAGGQCAYRGPIYDHISSISSSYLAHTYLHPISPTPNPLPAPYLATHLTRPQDGWFSLYPIPYLTLYRTPYLTPYVIPAPGRLVFLLALEDGGGAGLCGAP